MRGVERLGLDFGVSATVIAVSGPGRDTSTLEFPKISREFPASPGSRPVHTVPALVEYRDGKPVRLGNEALRGGTADAPSTARWLRRSLCDRSPVQVPAGNGRMVRSDEAVSDLLLPLLSQAFREYPGAGLIIALPPEAPAEYGELLQRVARSAGALSCSMVSEYDAALAGYGYSPPDGEPFVLLTFSETDLGVDVLARDRHPGAGAGGGSRLRVLARATGPVSCRAIDSLDRAGPPPEIPAAGERPAGCPAHAGDPVRGCPAAGMPHRRRGKGGQAYGSGFGEDLHRHLSRRTISTGSSQTMR